MNSSRECPEHIATPIVRICPKIKGRRREEMKKNTKNSHGELTFVQMHNYACDFFNLGEVRLNLRAKHSLPLLLSVSVSLSPSRFVLYASLKIFCIIANSGRTCTINSHYSQHVKNKYSIKLNIKCLYRTALFVLNGAKEKIHSLLNTHINHFL